MTTTVVIGGASGIGAAAAHLHRERGETVVVWDLADGVDINCDITDPDQIDRATEATLEQFGVPGNVSITAGVGHGAMLLDATVGEWDRVMNVNLRGVWLAMRALARPMLEGNGGSIVVTSSVSGRIPDDTMGVYCASKAALDMIVKVAALEWSPTVRVNAVAPGVTDTPMLPALPRDSGWLHAVGRRTALGGLGTAEDIAESLVAIHDMGWVTGQSIACDGGLNLHSPINPLGRG